MIWTRVTKDRYLDMERLKPPIAREGDVFLCGLPLRRRICRVTGRQAQSYMALAHVAGRYFETEDTVTIDEWKQGLAPPKGIK